MLNWPAPLSQTRESETAKEKEVRDLEKDGGIKRKMNAAGPYVPPAKLQIIQREAVTDKSSETYQRMAWEALRKSIRRLINKVTTSNVSFIVRNLFEENIVRGRGFLCHSILQVQSDSPKFTSLYAALIAVINSKFPTIGELLVKRCILQFKTSHGHNDKAMCLTTTKFIAHLVNQRMLHEVVAFQILMLLIDDSPTDDSVEIAILFLKECGERLTKVSSKEVNAIFDTLRYILHDNKVQKRIQYMIEVIFQVRKDEFKDFPAIIEKLDLIEEDDQVVHLVTLDDPLESQDMLNVFNFDPDYLESEKKYQTLCKEMLGSDDEEKDNLDDDGDSNENEKKKIEIVIIDATEQNETETNLVSFRKRINLTIQSNSLDYQACAQKLLEMQIKPGQERELCDMILDCCLQQMTYEKYYGLLAQRCCEMNRSYAELFSQIFTDNYHTIHQLKNMNSLKNVAKFFAHLLHSNSIPWTILSVIRLNEENTTSSSRMFIKILFQELTEFMGLVQMKKKILDPSLKEAFDGIFPSDNPKNARSAVNFFTSIGLRGLTEHFDECYGIQALLLGDELREFLKLAAKKSSASKERVQPPLSFSSSIFSSLSSSDSDPYLIVDIAK